MKKIICCLIIFQNIFCLSQTIDANGKKQGYWKKKDDKSWSLRKKVDKKVEKSV